MSLSMNFHPLMQLQRFQLMFEIGESMLTIHLHAFPN
ncbi:hypothetical protein VSAK1_15497 [Vibrio mediterranei AK1]|nr:hypothetical protein VSAK1_15497 [Vibrio mediterranei AK1]